MSLVVKSLGVDIDLTDDDDNNELLQLIVYFIKYIPVAIIKSL